MQEYKVFYLNNFNALNLKSLVKGYDKNLNI